MAERRRLTWQFALGALVYWAGRPTEGPWHITIRCYTETGVSRYVRYGLHRPGEEAHHCWAYEADLLPWEDHPGHEGGRGP